MYRWVPVVLVACTSPRSGLVIDRVDPATGPSTASTPVRIEGAGFRFPIVSNVDDGTTIVEEMRVEVGPAALGGWTLRSEQLIEGTVPAGLALGPHDVIVKLGRDEAILVGGFVVTDGAMPPDAGSCTLGPWGAPQPISELNTSGFEAMPRLSPDELVIYFHSQRAGGAGNRDVWTAKRTSTTTPFANPTNVSELNTSLADRDPSVTGDALEIVFSRGGTEDIHVATRAATGQPFSAPTLLDGVNTGSRDYFPFLSADGLTLYLASNRAGGTGLIDVWYATRPSRAASFSTPVNRSDVNSTANDFGAVLSPDGLELYFASDRVNDDTDVWVSTRSDPGAPFGAPVRIAELSTATNEDIPAWLSPDGRRLYFSSGVVGTSAVLYMATRPCL